ncbi:MAG: methyltransferase, TIGR04325 family [Verrucomicrobia bacterium]|nr:methyltransferase, TIGR04325 family [Verrucomicrobiota bacterium]
MSAAWAQRVKAAVPAAWRRQVRRWVRGPVYSGDYATWAAAAAASRGYADPVILEKTIAAARAVRDGRAAWERDTVQFPTPAANAPLLAALRRAAQGGRLNLVDFGGSLGSTWWQHRAWLSDLTEVRWSVVEQPALVVAGRREFTTGPLRFYDSLAACVAAEHPDVVLLSSVLPYLEAPHALLAEIRRGDFRVVLIDRTGFVARGRDRLTVQRVPPAIYAASYPCWFFDRPALIAAFGPGWRVAAEWLTDDEVDIDAQHGGLMLENSSLR